jgi:hypothetical protein
MSAGNAGTARECKAVNNAIQAQLDAPGIWPSLDEDAPICRRKAGDLIVSGRWRDASF